MRRREFLSFVAATLIAPPFAAGAQDRPAMLRVGTAGLTGRQTGTVSQIFVQRMRELGYVEGKNFVLDYVELHGSAGRYGAAMKEVVRRSADILLAFGPEAALKASIAASRTIPIIMVAIDYDPIARGYVTSLSRPTGNVTGMLLQQIALAAKRIQLVRDALPNMHAATVFWDDISEDQWRATQSAGETFGLRITGVKLTDPPYDYEKALVQVPPDHRGLLIPMTSPLFARNRERLVEFALRHRMASMFVFREYADAGGLMSYGPNRSVLVRRAADYADRLARGAKPWELPIEQPTTFELVINLKIAKALGITLAPAILLRANEVIE